MGCGAASIETHQFRARPAPKMGEPPQRRVMMKLTKEKIMLSKLTEQCKIHDGACEL